MNRQMTAAKFKAQCLKIMDEVAESGQAVVVTKRGKPIVQLAPMTKRPHTLRGFLKGKIKSARDIIAPVDVAWKAERK